MVAIASNAITFALVFYTIGVFAELRAGTLKLSHIMFFYLGLACDTAGTAVMSVIAPGNSASPAHAITGALWGFGWLGLSPTCAACLWVPPL